MDFAHSLPLAGHGGEQVTGERLKKFAYWKGMQKDVKAFVKSCVTCLRCKPSRDAPAPLLHFPEVNECFERVHMDLIGPLSTTSNGHKYVFTIIDALTRYLVAVPIPSEEARIVAQAFVSHVVCTQGTPR